MAFFRRFTLAFLCSTWGSNPPARAADMLRWLTTLSYQAIAEQASLYLADSELLEGGDKEPMINPRDAVFSVSLYLST